MLRDMLQMAQYAPEATQLHTDFFSTHVAPALGRFNHPSSSSIPWKSFMTDDHTPIELSWNWKPKSTTPTVRYSIEAIGCESGSQIDPLNTSATFKLLEKLTTLYPNIKCNWCSSLVDTLIINEPGATSYYPQDDTPRSQIFLGFELASDRIMLKIYLLPSRRAALEGKSSLALMKDSIKRLKNKNGEMLFDFCMVWNYLESFPDCEPRPLIMAIDAEEFSRARIKVYVRTFQTSFSSVVNTLEMNGCLPPLSEQALRALKELWQSVLHVDQVTSDTQPLPDRLHCTAGILYYFSVKAGSDIPKVKVYIPVRHYGTHDADIAHSLSAFLQRRGQGLGDDTYLQGLQRLW